MTPIRPDIPEHIPGEPALPNQGPISIFAQVIKQLVILLGIMCIGLSLLPFYALGWVLKGRPPNVPSAAQFQRYLVKVWTEQPPSPGLPFSKRLRITLDLLRRIFTAPYTGVCWFIDDLLYGRAMREVQIVEPLFELSAARSGSTQLAHYLEDDPHIVSPNLLQMFFPYLWMWKLMSATLGKVIPPEKVRKIVESSMPEAFLQRHEADPFRTDTFEISFFQSHMNTYSQLISPRMMIEDFAFGKWVPHNRQLWEEDFVGYLEGIGRKTMLFAGPAQDGKPRRLMIKGHFLAAAPALERRFPDARFLTMIREPDKRLQSAVNYFRSSPLDVLVGSPPWPFLVAFVEESEVEYCELEQEFYSRQGARRCVIRFKDYVKDLEGTMKKVYRECLDVEVLPPHVPTIHAERSRTNYLIDRSLEQLGIDIKAINQRLAPYIRWCRGQ